MDALIAAYAAWEAKVDLGSAANGQTDVPKEAVSSKSIRNRMILSRQAA